MTRARTNIETLVQRLISLGYRFAHPDRVFVPADEATRGLVAEIEGRAGPLPLSLRTWCEVVGEVNFMGTHPKLSTYFPPRDVRQASQDFLALLGQPGGPAVTTGDSLRQAFAVTQGLLQQVVQGIRTRQARSPEVAAGARAAQQFIEAMQRPTACPVPVVKSDPLVVEPYFGDLEDGLEESDEDAGQADPGSHSVIIAPDPVHKTNQSGGEPYVIEFPEPAVDAPLRGEEDYGTFVEYLRTCCRWGCFPGLRTAAQPPAEELAFLTQGLLPL
jgi:hypothetical protein